MRLLIKNAVIAMLIVGFWACTKKPFPTNKYPPKENIPTSYDEDLSTVRPHFDNIPSSTNNRTTTPEKVIEKERATTPIGTIITVNKQVNAILDTLASQNKATKYAQGYRILAYVGNNRTDMDNTKIYIVQNFPELNNYLSYNQPTYKLKIGDFMYRIDAESYFNNIKAKFSGATIINDRIDIRKSLQVK